jgi:amidase
VTTIGRDAVGIAAAVKAGEISAREVVEESIARIEKLDPQLNAVVAQRFDEALAEVDAGLPDGPLTGVPTLVKDLGMHVAGLPTTRGSRLWAGDVSAEDSELVARYKRAGMVVLGMTNSPELGKNASTEPLLHGPTHNPWSREHSPGGSSGGSAAAVASGMVPVAHGNDGGGSIRIPASMCGLFGLKPSRGRVSAKPETGALAYPLGINHALTHTVRDSALLLDIASAPVAGSAIGAPGGDVPFVEQLRRDPGRLRIGLVTTRTDGGAVDPEVVAAVRRTAALCEELGHQVEETTIPDDHAATMASFGALMGANLLAAVDRRLAELGRELRDDDLEPFTLMMYEHYRSSLSVTDLHAALGGVEETAWRVGRAFSSYDLLLTPTIALPVPELGVLDTSRPEVMWARAGDYSAFTGLFNTTGMPAMSVPAGVDATGLPLGAHFVADLGREGLLLSLAARLEEASPWPVLAPGY